MATDFASAAVAHPGEAVLYPGAYPLERAMARVAGDQMLDISAELIVENWDPSKVQEKNMPALAYAMGVTMWRDTWSEVDRRRWIADQWRFKALRGTLRAYEMAMGMMPDPRRPAKILHVIQPPQRFILHGPRTAEQEEALLGAMPEIRIYPFAAPQSASRVHGFYSGKRFWSVGRFFKRADTAWARHEHRAEYWINGVKVQDVRIARLSDTPLDEETQDFERVYFPNQRGSSRILGPRRVPFQRWWGKSTGARFAASFKSSPRVVGAQTVHRGLKPAEAKPVTVFQVHHAPHKKLFHSRQRFRKFRTRPDAERHVWRRLRLWDPAAAGIMRRGRTFWSNGMRGIRPKRAIMALKVPVPGVRGKRFHGHAKRGILASHNGAPLKAALEAIRAAKALSDDVQVDLDLYFERQFYGLED